MAHCKKWLAIFPSPSRDVTYTKLSLAGNYDGKTVNIFYSALDGTYHKGRCFTSPQCSQHSSLRKVLWISLYKFFLQCQHVVSFALAIAMEPHIPSPALPLSISAS